LETGKLLNRRTGKSKPNERELKMENNVTTNNVTADNQVTNQEIENMLSRVSIRRYTDQPVEEEKIQAMLRAAMSAPTAVNSQPWHFVVITDRDKLDKIEQYEAPLSIAVCGDRNNFVDMGPEWWIADCSMASDNILLAANSMGLGAIWTALYPLKQYMDRASQVLGLPDDLIPLNLINIGYPAENPRPKNKWNTNRITYIR
jgi:nitroreductase